MRSPRLDQIDATMTLCKDVTQTTHTDEYLNMCEFCLQKSNTATDESFLSTC